MEAKPKSHRQHRKKRKGFFKSLLRSLGILNKKKHRHASKSRNVTHVDTPEQRSLPEKSSRRKGSKSFIDAFFKRKKKHSGVSKFKSKPAYNPQDGNEERVSQQIEFGHHQPSKKSKAKYKKAVKSKNRKERRKQARLKWKRIWQDALYFLNLRDQPYDPFGKKEVNIQNKAKLMTIRQFAVYIFNSTVLFLITYIIAYLTYQFAVIFTSSFWGIDSVLYYYEVMFPIGNGSSLWSQFNIIMITLSGPLLSLILGLIYYRFFMPRDVFGPVTKLFFLWLSFHSFNMFFGAYVAGFITDQGFGYVVNWLYLRFFIRLALVMLALFVMVVIGYFATKPLLETSNSIQRISRENRAYFILTQLVIPWVLGGLILVLIKIPNKDPQHENIIVYDLIILGTLVFAIVPTFFNKKAKPDTYRFKSKRRIKFVWLFMFIAILLIVAYRIGLENGLHFIIRIMFRVAPYG